jgi:hypothetical protein
MLSDWRPNNSREKLGATSFIGGEITIMKKVVVLAVLVAAMAVPSAFATAELILSSGASTVDIVDGGVGDANPATGAVTFVGAVGSWSVNVTTGLEGDTPFFDLNSVDTTASQVAPIVMAFSDDRVLPPGFTLNAGGTVSTSGGTPTVQFGAFTGTSKFDFAHQIGSTLTFHATPFSGSTSGSTFAGDTSLSLAASIDLGTGRRGGASFDSALDSTVPEPASISMLGGGLLILGGALRRRIKKA